MNALSRYFSDKRQMVAGFSAFAGRHRRPLSVAALALFLIGLTLSIRQLDISARDLQPLPLLVNFLLLSPLSVLLTSWGLQISARVLARRIPTRTALTTTAVGTVAELLPIPAGVLARTAALVHAGAGPREIAAVLSMGGLLWFGLSAMAGSFALAQVNTTGNLLLLGAGFAALAMSLRWFASQTPLRWVLAVLAHRLVSLLLGILRICLTFAVLGSDLSILNAALLASANIIGSYSSIVPAGLGLGEALAALAAQAVVLSPSVAFTAIAMNRVLVLIVAGIFALFLGRRGRQPAGTATAETAGERG